MRNRIWMGMGALACALALAACGDDGGSDKAGGLKSDRVVFADYGGTTRTARTQAFLAPFGRSFDVSPVSADADPAKLQLFAERKRAEWDLIDMDGWDVVRFSGRGLLEKLPRDVDRLDLVPSKYRDYASGGYNASIGIGYRSDRGRPPTSWADFFDTARFPGKRALPNFAYASLEAALLGDGVACDKLYPLDFDRAFAKLDAIRGDLLFYDSFGQGVQYLAQGSVSMVLLPNSRVSVLKDQGLPVDFMWRGAMFQWTAAAVPRYAPHSDAAFALVDYMSHPERQAQFARLTRYGPLNSKALKLLDKHTLAQLPNAHLDVACKMDNEGLAKDIDEYTTRYTKWLAQD